MEKANLFCLAPRISVRQSDASAARNMTEQQLPLTSTDELRSDSIRKGNYSLSVCANGMLAASGSFGGTVQRWYMLTGEAASRPVLGHAEGSGVHSVAISRDGSLIVSSDSHDMVIGCDASAGKAIGEPTDGYSDEVSAIVISSEGKLIPTGSWDGTVRIWAAGTGEAMGKPIEGHSYCISRLAISTDGNHIVSGSGDGTIRRWDAGVGEGDGEGIEFPDLLER